MFGNTYMCESTVSTMKHIYVRKHSFYDEAHICEKAQFLRWSKTNLKTKFEWQTKHWTIDP